MKLFVVISIICAVTNGYPFPSPAEVPKASPPKAEDNPKGTTDYGYGNNGAYVKHTETLIDNDRFKLDGTAYANKNFHERTPLVTGGIIELGHKPTKSEFNINVQNTRGLPTQVSAAGQYNFFQTSDGRGKIGAWAELCRNYMGPFGTPCPQYGYGLRGSYVY